MSTLLLLLSGSSGPAPAPSGVFTLPVSWIASAVMADGLVQTTSQASFTGDESVRVGYIAGQI